MKTVKEVAEQLELLKKYCENSRELLHEAIKQLNEKQEQVRLQVVAHLEGLQPSVLSEEQKSLKEIQGSSSVDVSEFTEEEKMHAAAIALYYGNSDSKFIKMVLKKRQKNNS